MNMQQKKFYWLSGASSDATSLADRMDLQRRGATNDETKRVCGLWVVVAISRSISFSARKLRVLFAMHQIACAN